MSLPGSRQKPNILITGTPGTGKTTTASRVATELGFAHLNVSEIAIANKFVDSFDDQVASFNLDEDKLLDYLEAYLGSHDGGYVVEYHGCELFPERWFDLVIVLRCDNTLLYDRLKARGYNEKKLTDNIDCEIFGILSEEAKESYDEQIVHELASNTEEDVLSNVDRIVQWAHIYKPAT
uniref:Adenylate kinase isoenzyme 6 homolog n=1 Tax=Panagrellus redivivus TaxID=6233 RepID=A0A7E4VAU9_PANRE